MEVSCNFCPLAGLLLLAGWLGVWLGVRLAEWTSERASGQPNGCLGGGGPLLGREFGSRAPGPPAGRPGQLLLLLARLALSRLPPSGQRAPKVFSPLESTNTGTNGGWMDVRNKID